MTKVFRLDYVLNTNKHIDTEHSQKGHDVVNLRIFYIEANLALLPFTCSHFFGQLILNKNIYIECIWQNLSQWVIGIFEDYIL